MSGAVKVAVPLAIGAAAMYATGGTSGISPGLGKTMTANFMPAGGGGGLLAGFSSALSSMTPFQMLSTGTSVLQGIGALSQGNLMQSQYDLQAQQM